MEARRERARKLAMARSFMAKGWNDLDARASTIFDFSTANDTQKFLDVVQSGLSYADKTLNELTTKHSEQIVKNSFANNHIDISRARGEAVRLEENATEAQLDMMTVYYMEINKKTPILLQMKGREAVYARAVKSAGEMKGKMETVERVAGSLLVKQKEGAVVSKAVDVAAKCIDAEWLGVHTIRLEIAEEVPAEEKIRIKEFVASLEGSYADVMKMKMASMAEKDEVVGEDNA